MNIYVFSCEGFVKVGISKDVEKRLVQVRCAVPFKVNLEFSLRSENYRMIEKMVHNELSCHKVSGEWFDCSVGDAIDSVKKNADIASKAVGDNENYHSTNEILNEAKERGVSFMDVIWDKEREALHQMIEWFGSQSNAADAIGVSKQVVNNWVKRGRVSKAAAKLVEAATGGEFKASRMRLTND